MSSVVELATKNGKPRHRGKVKVPHITLAHGGGGKAAPDYLGCATALADAAQAGLLITHGLSGSGKSHVARAVAERG